MGGLLYLRDYKSREQLELEAMQAEQRKLEHEVCRIAFEGGPTIEVSMSDVEAYRNAPVEPPADCPA